MIDRRTKKDLKDIPVLEEPMLRVYVMRNSEGRVKIGKTKNIYQRYLSLCGSNSQGIEVIDVCCSPQTALYSLETIMHDKFDKYRIPNTEWFYNKEDPTGEKLFEAACEELRLLFSSSDYKRCNKTRKECWENVHKKNNKVGETNDN